MSRVDDMFVLHGLITHMLNGVKRFFYAYIYFTKAVDYLLRDKLIKLGVRGQLLIKVIKSMYENIKSWVKCNCYNKLNDAFS